MENTSVPSDSTQQGNDDRLSSRTISGNPFEQSVIVHHLSKFLSSDDPQTFKAFRQVCRLWREESQVKWNHLYGTLTICFNQPNEQDLHQNNNDGYTQVVQLDQFRRRYSNENDNLFKYPFQNYELRRWDLELFEFSDDEEAEEDPVENSYWFLTECGLQVKQLTLHHCNFLGTISPFSEIILENLPNLTHYKVIGGSISSEGLSEIERRYNQQIDYFKHHNLKNAHIELVLPEQMFHKLRCVFLKSVPDLEKLTIRRLSQIRSPELYQISEFAQRVMELRRDRLFSLENFELIEYASFNAANSPNYLQDFPDNLNGIQEIPGVVECFSVNRRKNRETGRVTLDLFLNPFCKGLVQDELPGMTLWKDVDELNIWGGINCSLYYLSKLKNLKVLRRSRGGWEEEECKRRILKYLEGNGGRVTNIPRSNEWEVEGTLNFWREQEKKARWKYFGGEFFEKPDKECVARMLYKHMRKLGDEMLTEKLIAERDKGEKKWLEGWRNAKVVENRKKYLWEKMGSNVEILEVDWRVGGGEKGVIWWRGLKKSMEGLREMRIVVEGDEVLKEVGRLWGKKLERFELGHWTSGLTKEGVMGVVVEGMGNLKEFRWRECPCLKKEMEGTDWREVEEGLREKLGEGNFTLPGKEDGGDLDGMCLENEFEKAVKTGRMEKSVLKMFEV